MAVAEPACVARQPILDHRQVIFGYELLFRSSVSSDACGGSPEAASASVISTALLNVGLDALTHGRRAFVNMTRRLLIEGVPEILPPGRVVLELTEDIDPDDEVLAACRNLRSAGYLLALDDFVLNERTAAFIPYADFVKVDFLGSDADARAAIAARCGRGGPVLLAEKVETVEAFEVANREGYRYFQGYFFGRPTIQPGRAMPGNHVHALRVLGALQTPNISTAEIEELVKPDVRLCYLILRTVNSAGFALSSPVTSIREALVLIGHDAVRRWASLWLLAGLGDGGHPELVSMAVTRARCCELLDARAAGPAEQGDGFLVGLCSLLDAILAMPMTEIVQHLPLTDVTRATLLGEDTPGRRRLDCVTAYERGDWDQARDLAAAAGVNPLHLTYVHADALRWSHQLKSDAAA